MKKKSKIIIISAFSLTLLTIAAPILSLISNNLKLSAKYAPGAIFIWVIIWITILRLSRNYPRGAGSRFARQISKTQNRLLTFLVIASSIAFTAFILYCFR